MVGAAVDPPGASVRLLLLACSRADSRARPSQSAFQPNSRHATAAPNGERRALGDACVDLHTECASWAASGECKRNPKYMIGDLGQCRVSCKDCPYPKALR